MNGPDKFGFHHGTLANFVDVFGEQKIFWFLPVYSGQVSMSFLPAVRTKAGSVFNVSVCLCLCVKQKVFLVLVVWTTM